MSINDFPAALQPIIQQGFLEREFSQALQSRLGYRAVADREEIAVGIGGTVTKTRTGLKPPVTAPRDAAIPREQYTIAINHYAATTDLNMVTSRVGIASQFLQNAYVNGEQAARGLDELARIALFAAYLSGNTWVRGNVVRWIDGVPVDDIRGFQQTFVLDGLRHVSPYHPLTITLGQSAYSITGAIADTRNVSVTPGGISGRLFISTEFIPGDCSVGRPVVAAHGPTIIRPSGRSTAAQLCAGDSLTTGMLLDAVARLRANGVPEIEGSYNCYLDPVSARQLFADPDFKQLFQGATSANQVFRNGMTNDFLGLRFIPAAEAYVQPHPTMPGLIIRRPIICGKGALVEGDFAGMAAHDVAPKDAIVQVVDGVAMVTHEAVDRLHQIIAQSWYWIGGFAAPANTSADHTTIAANGTNAMFKRAVVLEHIG